MTNCHKMACVTCNILRFTSFFCCGYITRTLANVWLWHLFFSFSQNMKNWDVKQNIVASRWYTVISSWRPSNDAEHDINGNSHETTFRASIRWLFAYCFGADINTRKMSQIYRVSVQEYGFNLDLVRNSLVRSIHEMTFYAAAMTLIHFIGFAEPMKNEMLRRHVWCQYRVILYFFCSKLLLLRAETESAIAFSLAI